MSSKLSQTTLIVGIVVLVGFGALTWYMIFMNSGLPKDQQWDHLVVIFNSIQAMAAAALGVLLGTTVQQARVDAAHAREALAEKKSRDNEKEGLKNEAIRSLLGESRALTAETAEPAATLSAVRKILDS